MNRNSFRLFRAEAPGSGCLAKMTVFAPDRPGSIAGLAGLLARHGCNITFFDYNRSVHPNRVLLEATGDAAGLAEAGRELEAAGLFKGETSPPELELGVLDAGNILKLNVRLENRPGTLGEFAALLSRHEANVIFMAYNEDVSATSAAISLVTRAPGEIDRLLKEMNELGYPYSVRYRGAERKEVEDIIGLNLVERFYFRLKGLLGTEDVDRLRRLVDSSRRLSDTLIRFSREAGGHLEGGEVLTKVLAFASASLSRTGDAFSWRSPPMPPQRGAVACRAFALPTGGNLFILEGGGERVMIDGGYGHYFDDVKEMLRVNGLDPASIKRIYLTHPDADHAGLSGWFAEEFGSRVFLHPGARGVLEAENRAWGSDTPLLELNHWFTILVNEFTRFRVPGDWTPFNRADAEAEGGFRVIDRFEVGGEPFEVLESPGGHIPGQVFFLGRESGLAFTGDFLLNVDSLSPEDRAILDLPRFMMTSTNADSRLFRREMDALRRFLIDVDRRLQQAGRRLTVIPGHGNPYGADLLR